MESKMGYNKIRQRKKTFVLNSISNYDDNNTFIINYANNLYVDRDGSCLAPSRTEIESSNLAPCSRLTCSSALCCTVYFATD